MESYRNLESIEEYQPARRELERLLGELAEFEGTTEEHGEIERHILNSRGVCEKGTVGLLKDHPEAGMLKQFSERYPTLTLEVTAEGGQAAGGFDLLTIRNGKVLTK